MNKLSSLPVGQKFALGAAWVLPCVAFGILATNILPEPFRFQKWPSVVQDLCIVLFGLFVLAGCLFAVWYVVLSFRDEKASEDKKRGLLVPPSGTTTPEMPPITRHVTLPAVVAVRYLADLLKMSPQEIASLSGYSELRSMPFDQAQKILRRYGIWANKAV
jgi:hypothetical protein